jgi:hypothetical protein
MLKEDGSNALEWEKETPEKFWLPLIAKNEDGEIETTGHVQC